MALLINRKQVTHLEWVRMACEPSSEDRIYTTNAASPNGTVGILPLGWIGICINPEDKLLLSKGLGAKRDHGERKDTGCQT